MFTCLRARRGKLADGRLRRGYSAAGPDRHAPTRAETLKKLESEARSWIKSASAQRYRYCEKTGNKKYAWVGGRDHPFPLNPDFKPQAPLNDHIKEEIYKEYLSDPAQNSPRKLAEKYKLEIVRVEAILRLKALEKQMEKGHSVYPIQNELCKGMEDAMDIARYRSVADYFKENRREPEPARLINSVRLKPLFQLADGEDYLTPEDAAKLLQKNPYANILNRLDRQADNIENFKEFKLKPPEQLLIKDKGSHTVAQGDLEQRKAASKVLEESQHLLAGTPLLIHDTSKHRKHHKMAYYIRDEDGCLRSLTKIERLEQIEAIKKGERLYQPHVSAKHIAQPPGTLPEKDI